MPFYNLTTANPTGSGNTTLFDTTVHFGGAKMIPNMGVERIAFSVYHDQAGTLTAYASSNGGTNWDAYWTQAVPAPAANNISGPFDFVINTYLDWKLVWTNGGSNQTVWRPTLQYTEATWEAL